MLIVKLAQPTSATSAGRRYVFACRNAKSMAKLAKHQHEHVMKTVGPFAFHVVGRVGFVLAAMALDGFGAEDGALTTEIKAAVSKSLPLLERGARGSMEKRKLCSLVTIRACPLWR